MPFRASILTLYPEMFPGPLGISLAGEGLRKGLWSLDTHQIREHGIGRERFELQMLYGLRRRRWRELVRDGYDVRVYVPYGTHWLPYFYRRLRERRQNAAFVVRHLVHG